MSKADAYGQVILDHFEGRSTPEIIERDDGWLGVSGGGPAYFAPFRDWPAHERQAIRLARGRVVDIGCGAGRVGLHLQEQGLEVVGIDTSPGAIRVCRKRGLTDCRVLPITRISRKLGPFDTLVLFGNSFGLVQTPERAPWLLGRFAAVTGNDARILATSRRPDPGGDADHRRYYRRNREAGRFPGQVRIRVRCGAARSPWFDHLNVSPAEMRRVVKGSAWKVTRVFESDGPHYAALLEKR